MVSVPTVRFGSRVRLIWRKRSLATDEDLEANQGDYDEVVIDDKCSWEKNLIGLK